MKTARLDQEKDKTAKSKSLLELRILKTILFIYVVLCIVIAGLNYGYASRATPQVATFITQFWNFYENWITTIFIIVGSFLTLRIIGKSKQTTMRKRNLTGFISAALVIHIFGPLLLQNQDLYFFAMPIPWTTVPMQLLYPHSSFYVNNYPIWGASGISATLIFYLAISAVVLVGTLLLGRRLQCSTLCLFNGFAAEVFAPAIPIFGKEKKVTPKILRIFGLLRWIFLAIGIFFTVWWILFLFGVPIQGSFQLIGNLESYKYLSAELLISLFFWVAFIGRGYCYYCPLGTTLAFISKIAGQKIITDQTNCINCGQCNQACPMSIDIRAKALRGQASKELRCVGCGHCIDVCPTKTLAYETRFYLFYRLKARLRKGRIDISA